jgi:hypothetical protein
MRKVLWVTVTAAALVLAAWPVLAADETAPWAAVDSCAGDVRVGVPERSDWAPAVKGMPLTDGQTIKTGAQGQATVRFPAENLLTLVGEGTQVSLQDLLLKARLEKMRGKISQPQDGASQTKMQVTPLTGLRGTDQAEDKAEGTKRQHYWQEDAEPK